MRAHLQKAAIITARLADEDRLDRRLHVVVDAAPADAAIKLECLVVSVEHQLLGLAKIDAHERHPTVRQLHVRRLDRQRQSLERDRLVAPVELVGLPGAKLIGTKARAGTRARSSRQHLANRCTLSCAPS